MSSFRSPTSGSHSTVVVKDKLEKSTSTLPHEVKVESGLTQEEHERVNKLRFTTIKAKSRGGVVTPGEVKIHNLMASVPRHELSGRSSANLGSFSLTLPAEKARPEIIEWISHTTTQVPFLLEGFPEPLKKTAAYLAFEKGLYEFLKNSCEKKVGATKLDVGVEIKAGLLTITIKDNGIGFSKKTLEDPRKAPATALRDYFIDLEGNTHIQSDKKKSAEEDGKEKSLGGSGFGMAQFARFLHDNDGQLLYGNAPEGGAVIKLISTTSVELKKSFEQVLAENVSPLGATTEEEAEFVISRMHERPPGSPPSSPRFGPGIGSPRLFSAEPDKSDISVSEQTSGIKPHVRRPAN